jgi:hypothetical protein
VLWIKLGLGEGFRPLLGLRLVLLADLGLDLGIGACHFLLLALLADFSRIEHAALVGVLDDIGVLLARDQLLQRHHRSVVEHHYYYFK